MPQRSQRRPVSPSASSIHNPRGAPPLKRRRCSSTPRPARASNSTAFEDVDELDAFTGTEAVSVQSWAVPLVQKMNPADPKDSRQSRQAEKRGRLDCDDEEMSEDENRNAELALAAAAVIPIPISRAEIHDSDDELDNWDTVDESNIVSPMTTAKTEKTQSLNSPPARCTPQPPSSSKQSSNRKRGSQLQLQTPPRSRTPSFADDVPTPIASLSPPSSPLPPLRSSSRTKSKPKAVPKPVDRFISQVRTRTQSRPPTDSLQEPILKLDLAAAPRGRSASRRLVTRTSVSEPAESVEGPTSSRKLGPPSSNRSAGTSKTKVSLSSKTVGVSPNSKCLESVEQLPRAAFRKGKERHRGGELIAHDRKGKGRASDVEERSVDVDREQEDSDDPLGLPPSPTPPYRPGGRGSATTATKERENSHSSSTERSPLPRSPEPLQTSPKKRKRKSSSSDGEESAQHADFNSPRFPSSSSSLPSPNKTRLSKSRGSSDNSEGCFHSESEFEAETQPAFLRPHPHQMSGAIPPYYPPSFYPYPPFPPSGDGRPTPLQDPRAQFIISQAMHQLSTLFTTPWSAQPFTPIRHPSSTRSAPGFMPSLHSYRTVPHHGDTHPYVLDSGASADTLPPSSPPSPSSSPLRGHGDGRRGSLVPRSHSRGRRVSFNINEDLRHHRAGQAESEEDGSSARQETKRSSDRPEPSSRRKKQMMVAGLSDSEAGSRINVMKTRSGVSARAQTPGPPIVHTVSLPSIPASRINSTTVKPKGKARKTI
ncbi:hypothetical protein K438DRAFT_1944198 [Mycena galopus ATCC 62051]|nr:hypothetical protein K438DRAFT_1944198 [Mycena galopus ATCC 62051]